MILRYVGAELWRNPRRTLSATAGVVLGVGLFCGVLFFVDGLSASMTQRALDPLAIDMQRIVTEGAAGTLTLTQSFPERSNGNLERGSRTRIDIHIVNGSEVPNHDVTIRSVPDGSLRYVPGSAVRDGVRLETLTAAGTAEESPSENPFASGPARRGTNIGSLEAGQEARLSYLVEANVDTKIDDRAVVTAFSSRESASPSMANQRPPESLGALRRAIAEVPGVARTSELSIADLGPNSLDSNGATVDGAVKVFGFDDRYAAADPTVRIVDGTLEPSPDSPGTKTPLTAGLSSEAASELALGIGDTMSVSLPDSTTVNVRISAITDLSEARSLFSSRRGGDLETFIYAPYSVVLSPTDFADAIFPAFERAATAGSGRLKNPPIREVDIAIDRERLDAEPAAAAAETQAIATAVMGVAQGQDYLLDNITNTLTVAAGDARTAKTLFGFLGVPGALLAAILAAYSGNVLAESQRHEHATLRIRGASRTHLLRMLMLRTGALTATGAALGLIVGYAAAAVILGQASLSRASTASLATSAIAGTLGGFIVTGGTLYVTGRRPIDREINEDRARLVRRPPLWRRARLDLLVLAFLAVATAVALRVGAFDGTAGSVYFGRSVQLNLWLLALPLAAWFAGCLLLGRVFTSVLLSRRPASNEVLHTVVPALYLRSVTRRPWPIGSGAVVMALIVAISVSLATFTASYDEAKSNDARYANGSDLRITPNPASSQIFSTQDAAASGTDGVAATTAVVFGPSNVILRSDRTSDPANLAALEPAFGEVAPVEPEIAAAVNSLESRPGSILLSREMADFLQTAPGDKLSVLLARATDAQVEVELTITGLFDRLPGFPEGADAVMSLAEHTDAVPTKAPDFFLASTDGATATAASASLQRAATRSDGFHIDTLDTVRDRDQSSLAALNIGGLVRLDSAFALAMSAMTIAVFVFGLLLQRRREYVTLRAQGLPAGRVRALIAAEASTVAVAGVLGGTVVGLFMAYYFVLVLRPLFVLTPAFTWSIGSLLWPAALVGVATLLTSLLGSGLVNRLDPTELLRDE